MFFCLFKYFMFLDTVTGGLFSLAIGSVPFGQRCHLTLTLDLA